MRIKNRVCLAIHGDGGGLKPDDVAGESGYLFFGEGDAWFQIVFFRIGDTCIHEGFVFLFVIGIAIEITHASELGHLVPDEFLFIESVTEPFIYLIVIPKELVVHVVRRKELLFVGEGGIGLDEILGLLFWMELVERAIWDKRQRATCFFSGCTAWIGFFPSSKWIQMLLDVISHGLGDVFFIWVLSCVSFIGSNIKRGGVVQLFLWRHENLVPIVPSPCLMGSMFSFGVAFLCGTEGDFLHLILFGNVVQCATVCREGTPSGDTAVFIGHVAREDHIFPTGNVARFRFLHLFF